MFTRAALESPFIARACEVGFDKLTPHALLKQCDPLRLWGGSQFRFKAFECLDEFWVVGL